MWYGLNRTYCDVCSEIRAVLDQACMDTWFKQRDVIRSLVEELQVYGNRMEASLGDIHNIESLHDELKEGRKKLKVLKEKIKKLEEQAGVESDDDE